MTTKEFLLSQLDEAKTAIQEDQLDDAIETMNTVYAMIRKIQDAEARGAHGKRRGY